jgi:hypothetical protein
MFEKELLRKINGVIKMKQTRSTGENNAMRNFTICAFLLLLLIKEYV